MLSSYKLKHDVNRNKQTAIHAVKNAYRVLACQLANFQWKLFQQTFHFNKNAKLTNICSPLSERYKQTCNYQVVGQLASFISNKQNDFVEYVTHSTIDSKLKRELYKLNRQKKWYTHSLAKTIWRHILKTNSKPSFNNANLCLDAKVAILTPNVSESKFDYWIKLSTLVKGQTICLPLKSNSYFEQAVGTLKNFCQLNFSKESQEFSVSLMKEKEPSIYISQTPQIALDIGLKCPIATSEGDMFSRKFYDKLCKLDKQITTLAANRQKQGLKVRSPRYDKLIRKLRSYLQNELSRILNRIVELYKPQEIVVEKLDFSNPNLGRRMNRLLTNFGKKFIKEKLARLTEEFGIKITEVNCAYTSKTCSNCGYVDERNRKTQEEFECKHCGKKLNADVNGARSTLIRSSDKELTVYKSVKATLNIIVNRFVEQYSCWCSSAKGLLLLEGNSYFESYLSRLAKNG